MWRALTLAAARTAAYAAFTLALFVVAAWLRTWEFYGCLDVLSDGGGTCSPEPIHPNAVLLVPIGIAVVLVVTVLTVELGLRRRK